MTLCSVTGSGKSVCMSALIEMAQRYGNNVSLFTNRRLLTQQTAKNLTAHGISFGVRAASMPKHRDLGRPVQISSMQTEIARCIESDQWELHKADLALVDEAHMMGSGKSLELIQRLMAMGTKIVLVTATPVGLNHITPNLYVASCNSEMRACGALVPAIVKSASEMDCSRVRRVKERFDLASIRETAWRQAIIGHVLEDYKRFNPNRRMALGFAPGVPESRALAQYFHNNGVRAAHIDASEVWANGVYAKDNATGDVRRQVVDDWRAGKIDVLWNCEVFREAIDVPELFHLILATPIASIKDYTQVVGRVLRKSAATPDYVLVQDHAGNCFRHGSPNQDIDWHELYTMTEAEICEAQEKKREEQKPEEVPAACPKCGTVVKWGSCPPPPIGCGEPITKTNPRKMRFVVQESGALKTVPESAMRPKKRKASTASQEQKNWDSIWFGARNSKSNRAMTFEQAAYMYRNKFKSELPSNLNRLPIDKADWKRKIRDVSPADLTQGA